MGRRKVGAGRPQKIILSLCEPHGSSLQTTSSYPQPNFIYTFNRLICDHLIETIGLRRRGCAEPLFVGVRGVVSPGVAIHYRPSSKGF